MTAGGRGTRSLTDSLNKRVKIHRDLDHNNKRSLIEMTIRYYSYKSYIFACSDWSRPGMIGIHEKNPEGFLVTVSFVWTLNRITPNNNMILECIEINKANTSMGSDGSLPQSALGRLILEDCSWYFGFIFHWSGAGRGDSKWGWLWKRHHFEFVEEALSFESETRRLSGSLLTSLCSNIRRAIMGKGS